MPKRIPMLNQGAKNDFPRPKCISQCFGLHKTFWLRPNLGTHIDFQVMFLLLWPKVISHLGPIHLA